MHLHEEVPSVVRLALHLLGMHSVIFNPNDDAMNILSHVNHQKTTLTAFFEICATLKIARQYTYQEFSQHFVGFAIGRLYFADPSTGECFYLQLLLTVVSSPQSFEHLKIVNNVQYPTFKSACIALGLLENDGEWDQCLKEASVMRSGSQLRALFAVILTQCTPTYPEKLWLNFHTNICDDLCHQLRHEHAIEEPTENQIYDYGFFLINEILRDSNHSLARCPSMPL
ncbi:10073_t:CDS:2 [Cetraspora pellucida]|uniref:10073_t:CDS:1 n=1 Tax=Cetraspora pellucida TaxID=1433469 RepID=A0A9N9J9K4_9GLOM|nr:10073_t:CDS:2 [Cetraspora pellucida]